MKLKKKKKQLAFVDMLQFFFKDIDLVVKYMSIFFIQFTIEVKYILLFNFYRNLNTKKLTFSEIIFFFIQKLFHFFI